MKNFRTREMALDERNMTVFLCDVLLPNVKLALGFRNDGCHNTDMHHFGRKTHRLPLGKLLNNSHDGNKTCL